MNIFLRLLAMNRCKLSELSETSYDVLVIGAGINGAGAAQQLAAGGYNWRESGESGSD